MIEFILAMAVVSAALGYGGWSVWQSHKLHRQARERIGWLNWAQKRERNH